MPGRVLCEALTPDTLIGRARGRLNLVFTRRPHRCLSSDAALSAPVPSRRKWVFHEWALHERGVAHESHSLRIARGSFRRESRRGAEQEE